MYTLYPKSGGNSDVLGNFIWWQFCNEHALCPTGRFTGVEWGVVERGGVWWGRVGWGVVGSGGVGCGGVGWGGVWWGGVWVSVLLLHGPQSSTSMPCLMKGSKAYTIACCFCYHS